MLLPLVNISSLNQSAKERVCLGGLSSNFCLFFFSLILLKNTIRVVQISNVLFNGSCLLLESEYKSLDRFYKYVYASVHVTTKNPKADFKYKVNVNTIVSGYAWDEVKVLYHSPPPPQAVAALIQQLCTSLAVVTPTYTATEPLPHLHLFWSTTIWLISKSVLLLSL